jgi:hypothetical protein
LLSQPSEEEVQWCHNSECGRGEKAEIGRREEKGRRQEKRRKEKDDGSVS